MAAICGHKVSGRSCGKEARWYVWYGRAVPVPETWPMYGARCDEHVLLPSEHWPVYMIKNISLSRLVAIEEGKRKRKEKETKEKV